MENGATTRWRVIEVHNFGGFFGGDTVTLTAARWQDNVEETITIDEKSLVNMQDRFKVAPSMVFDLLMAGDRVDRAELLGAEDWPILDAAIDSGIPQAPLMAPAVRAYRCERCGLWVSGPPILDSIPRCRLCNEPI